MDGKRAKGKTVTAMTNLPPILPFNFGGLDEKLSSFKNARFVILPVPYDLTASYGSGIRDGPLAIIEASTHMELYDEELRANTYEAGIHTLSQMKPTTLGHEEIIKRVQEASSYIIKSNKIPVMLGGEHSITLGMVKALKKKYPNLSVLQFDAHADMRDSYQDNPFNHACVARRISEICPIVQVGIRSLSEDEAIFLRKGAKRQKQKITTYYADIKNGKFSSQTKLWSKIVKHLTNDVFITIDLDVFDPSIMPAIGTPEPGGMGWYDVLGILKAVIAKKNTVGFDVVELCPIPGNIAPNFLAAKLIYRIMGYITKSSKLKVQSSKRKAKDERRK